MCACCGMCAPIPEIESFDQPCTTVMRWQEKSFAGSGSGAPHHTTAITSSIRSPLRSSPPPPPHKKYPFKWLEIFERLNQFSRLAIYFALHVQRAMNIFALCPSPFRSAPLGRARLRRLSDGVCSYLGRRAVSSQFHTKVMYSPSVCLVPTMRRVLCC